MKLDELPGFSAPGVETSMLREAGDDIYREIASGQLPPRLPIEIVLACPHEPDQDLRLASALRGARAS